MTISITIILWYKSKSNVKQQGTQKTSVSASHLFWGRDYSRALRHQ